MTRPERRQWLRFSVAYQIPIRQLQETMTSAEFVELCAFANLEPFGERLADHRASVMAAVVANTTAYGRKQYQPSDFPIIDTRRQRERQAPLIDRWHAFVRRHNEGVKNGRHS